MDRFKSWLAFKQIPWPTLKTGRLALSDDCFREMSKAYPAEVAPIRELRHSLSQLRLESLAVGDDGRNRCLLGHQYTDIGQERYEQQYKQRFLKRLARKAHDLGFQLVPSPEKQVP